MGSALPGWRWHRAGFEVTVFAGLDVQDHRFTPNEPNRLRGTHVGARGGFDVWYEPFANAMLTASASLSTVGNSYWTRAAAGWRFFDMIWLGPEVLACGDDTYRQFRFGAHVTSLRFRSYEFAVGGGWATDSDGRDGAVWAVRRDLSAVRWSSTAAPLNGTKPGAASACYASDSSQFPFSPCASGKNRSCHVAGMFFSAPTLFMNV